MKYTVNTYFKEYPDSTKSSLSNEKIGVYLYKDGIDLPLYCLYSENGNPIEFDLDSPVSSYQIQGHYFDKENNVWGDKIRLTGSSCDIVLCLYQNYKPVPSSDAIINSVWENIATTGSIYPDAIGYSGIVPYGKTKIGDDDDTVFSLPSNGGTQIIELCAKFTKPGKLFITDKSEISTTEIDSYAYTGTNTVYSFYDQSLNKGLLVDKTQGRKVFAIHANAKDDGSMITTLNGLKPAITAMSVSSSGSGVSVPPIPPNYRARCIPTKRVNQNIWATYETLDGTKYFSITVNENNTRTFKSLKLLTGYEYTFNLYTHSEENFDGIILATSQEELDNLKSLEDYTDQNRVCSGINKTKTYTYTPTEDTTVYIFYFTDETYLGEEIDEDNPDSIKYEYGDVEVVKKSLTTDITYYENGVESKIHIDSINQDIDIPTKITLTYKNDQTITLPTLTSNASFKGWGSNTPNGTIYNTTDSYSLIKLGSDLYAQYGVDYKVLVKLIGNDQNIENAKPKNGITVVFKNGDTILYSANSNDYGLATYSLTLFKKNDSKIPDTLTIGIQSSIYNLVDPGNSDGSNVCTVNETATIYISPKNEDLDDNSTKNTTIEHFQSLSAYYIKNNINNSTNIEYASTNGGNFKIRVLDPDSVDTYDVFTCNPVVMDNEDNIIGSVDICLKSNANDLKLKTINRYSGYYNPIFKDIMFYDNYDYSDEELPYSNTSFDNDYEDDYGKFGVINNMWIHKVNEDDSTKIVSYLEPYYPLIGQYALDYKDYNLFSSNWDKDYYTKQLDTLHSGSCNNISSMKNGLCMFGSKYLNTPKSIEIECFNGCEDWNDEWVTDPNGCSGEMMYKEKSNSVEFYFFLRKRILRHFYEKLEPEFKKYISDDKSYGETGLEDDINAYVEKNILKLYQLDKIRVFIRRTKSGIPDNQIENDYVSYINKCTNELIESGFEEVNTLSMTKINTDDFDRKVVYNLKTQMKEEFGFSFVISKI